MDDETVCSVHGLPAAGCSEQDIRGGAGALRCCCPTDDGKRAADGELVQASATNRAVCGDSRRACGGASIGHRDGKDREFGASFSGIEAFYLSAADQARLYEMTFISRWFHRPW
jgi:hypothetical protein